MLNIIMEFVSVVWENLWVTKKAEVLTNLEMAYYIYSSSKFIFYGQF